MTPPMTAPVTWEVKAVLAGMIVFAIAMPFVRREDWIGWLALSALFACTVGLWCLLIRGMVFHTFRRWRRRGGRD